MTDAPISIALLARAGDAREQLRRALVELGAELVAEGDPAELDPAALLGLKPKVVLISLEPAIEDALDRFNEVLASPDIEVMFDDAEVTRSLEGWDLARWARHLAAKLVGSDVLPPAPAGSEGIGEVELRLEPGAPPTPAQLMDSAKLEDYAAEAGGLLDEVPSEPLLSEVAVEVAAVATDSGADGSELDLGIDIDLSQLEQAMSPQPDAAAEELPAATAEAGESLDLDTELPTRSFAEMAGDTDAGGDLDFSLDVDIEGLDRALAQDAAPADSTDDEAATGLLADMDFDSDAPVSFASLADDAEPDTSGLDIDADVAALAAQLDEGGGLSSPADDTSTLASEQPGFDLPEFAAAEAHGDGSVADASGSHEGLGELSLPDDFELPTVSSAGEAETSAYDLDDSSSPGLPDIEFAAPNSEPAVVGSEPANPMSLALDDGETALPLPVAFAKSTGSSMFAGMTLSLESEDDAPALPGLALALAGLGGPDAIKQVLRALPTRLPVPVVLYQHLDNGKYDRLAEQLGKGSSVPMRLAEAGQALHAGEAFLLPPGLGVGIDGAGFRFIEVDGTQAMLRSLPAARSVVLALSGAAADLVAGMQAIAAQGGLLLAQSPEGCFDTAAIDALISAGVTAASPSELALQLSLRWNA